MYVCTYVYICMYVSVYVYMYVCTYVCMCVCMCVLTRCRLLNSYRSFEVSYCVHLQGIPRLLDPEDKSSVAVYQ
jgi:hypothetical protein